MAKKVVEEEDALKLKALANMTEELSTEIAKISHGMEILTGSRLKFSTLVLLISKASGVPNRTVMAVLESLPTLEAKFLKK